MLFNGYSFRHTAVFSNFVMNHTLSEVISFSHKRRCEQSVSLIEQECMVSPSKRVFNNTTNVVTNTFPHLARDSKVSTEFLSTNSEHKVHSSNSDKRFSGYGEIKSFFGGLNGGQSFVYDNQNSLSTTVSNEQNQTFIPFLYQEIHNLFKILWSGQRTVVSPSNLLYAVWTTLPTFKGYKQQDAQEFLSLLLDRLQAEIHGLSTNLSITSQDFINRAFRGYYVSHIRCSSCHIITCIEEPIFELSLSLPASCYSGESTECNLVDLIRQYVSATDIDGETYACRNCNNKFLNLESANVNCTNSSLEKFNYTQNNIYLGKQIL